MYILQFNYYMFKMIHKPVLLNETIDCLNINPNGIYVDLTLGGGGHSKAILNKLSDKGRLIAFDQDIVAINIAKENLKEFSNLTIINSNFKNLKQELNLLNIFEVDGIIMDLGMSSFQIDDPKRGFSYMQDGPLDMRMDKNNPLTAEEILNTYELDQLNHIFKLYGEEPNSYRLAKLIVENRPFKTTLDVVEITDLVPTKGHSAKRVFQALRIYINSELKVLENVLPDCLELLKENGVLATITFHSLEDAIVKNFIKDNAVEKIIKGLPLLPKVMPLRYGKRKFVKPSKEELNENSRSKSAILRYAIKNKGD